MMANQLTYQILTQNTVPPTLKINFKDSWFLRSVRLTSTSAFPTRFLEAYELQVHPKFMLFTQIKPTKVATSIRDLTSIMDSLLGSVRVRVIRIKREQIEEQKLYHQMLRLLDFNCCWGYKLHTKNSGPYVAGELVLYYCVAESNKVNDLVQCIKGFISKLVYFPLRSLIQKNGLPEHLTRPTLKQMLNNHGSQIQSIAVLHKIHISFMGICKRQDDSDEDQPKQYFLLMKIEGFSSNMHLFYVALEYTIESFRLRLVEIQLLRGIKPNDIASVFPFQQGTRMIDMSYVVIMDRNITSADISQAMIGDYIFGKNDFKEEEVSILEFEIKRSRFRDYMDEKQIKLHEITVRSGHVIVTCRYDMIPKLKKCLYEFLQLFHKVTVNCTELEPMVCSIFHKNYRQRIEQKLNVKFQLVNGKITRTNYQIDSEKISAEIANANHEILQNFIVVPSLNTISKYLAQLNNFQGMYTVEKNPDCMWEKSWRSIKYRWMKSEIQLLLVQFGNLVKYQQHILLIMHNDLLDSSKIYEICAQNKIDIKQFLAGCEGVKPNRIRKYNLKISHKFKSITLLYFDVKRINIRHIDEDIFSCFRGLEKQEKLNMLIGINSKRFVEEVMLRFLNKMNELAEQQSLKTKYINIYYEQQSLLAQLERVVINTKMEAVVVTRDLLNEWSILRMNNLKEYVLSYFWNGQTWTLPGMDSYIFEFQRKRSSKSRAILTIPTPNHLEMQYHQFLVDMQAQIIYEVCYFYKVNKYDIQQVSKQLQRLIKVINKQFNPVYFVAYARNSDGKIGKQPCLELYYTQQKNKQLLIALNLDLKKGEISLRKSDPVFFNLSQKKYTDWFKINTHASEIHNVLNCLQV